MRQQIIAYFTLRAPLFGALLLRNKHDFIGYDAGKYYISSEITV